MARSQFCVVMRDPTAARSRCCPFFCHCPIGVRLVTVSQSFHVRWETCRTDLVLRTDTRFRTMRTVSSSSTSCWVATCAVSHSPGIFFLLAPNTHVYFSPFARGQSISSALASCPNPRSGSGQPSSAAQSRTCTRARSYIAISRRVSFIPFLVSSVLTLRAPAARQHPVGRAGPRALDGLQHRRSPAVERNPQRRRRLDGIHGTGGAQSGERCQRYDIGWASDGSRAALVQLLGRLALARCLYLRVAAGQGAPPVPCEDVRDLTCS